MKEYDIDEVMKRIANICKDLDEMKRDLERQDVLDSTVDPNTDIDLQDKQGEQ